MHERGRQSAESREVDQEQMERQNAANAGADLAQCAGRSRNQVFES
jgi:hypothetical protein